MIQIYCDRCGMLLPTVDEYIKQNAVNPGLLRPMSCSEWYTNKNYVLCGECAKRAVEPLSKNDYIDKIIKGN